MLQFLLGGLMRDKQAVMIDRMKKLLETNTVKQVFYLVPDHMKFDSEIQVLSQLNVDEEVSGSIHTQVYSFSRLAWFLLKDTGVLTKRALSQSGLSMLLRHTLMQLEGQLIVYRGQMHKQGFIEQLLDLFLEFKSGNMAVSTLQEYIQDTQEKSVDFTKKLAELTLIYDHFTQALVGQYIEKDDLFEALMTYILDMDLSQTAIFLNGYERFTAQELRIVEALMMKGQSVTIALPIVNKTALIQDNYLSFVPVQTYRLLESLAKKHNIKIATDTWVTQQRLEYSPDMVELLTFWENDYPVAQSDIKKTESQALVTHYFASKQEEVNAVIREITRLVTSKSYRYKDIHVLMRQVEEYENLLKPLFKESDLPVFIDNAESMASHPLVECLAALQAIQERNWQYEDVMRLLRCQLLDVGTLEEIDLLENELLKQGYAYRYWWEDSVEWGEHEPIRQRIVNVVMPFLDELKQADTMKKASQLLYEFFVESGVKRAILDVRNSCLEAGELQRAKQQEQVWHTFTKLLDEFVLILGDTPYDSAIFYDTLLNGFQHTEYSLVPPSLDQVTISSLDSKYVSPAKVVFVLGADRFQFPKAYDNATLLNDKEREALQQVCSETTYLALPTKYRTMIEPFVAYQVFARASDKLYISHVSQEVSPQINEKTGEATDHLLSPYVERLKTRFRTTTWQKSYGRYHQMVRALLQNIYEAYTQQQVVSATDNALWFALATDERFKEQLNRVSSSLTYKNVPVRLENPKELYEGQLHLSVSQLETYFKDPYSHYLQYGLRLKERDILEVNAISIGNVAHDVLDQFYKTLDTQHLRIEQLNDNQLQDMVDETIQRVFQDPKYRVFSRNNTMRFTQTILADTLHHVSRTLQQYARLVRLDTVATEWSFDSLKREHAQTLHLAPIPLGNGDLLHLRGKIDRMDIVDGKYMSIVDYKSSDKTFNPRGFFMGTAMQLMTYLHVMAQNHQRFSVEKDAILGAFYYHIKNTYEKVEKEEDDVNRTLQKLKGPVVLDSHAAASVENMTAIYPMRLTKEGKYYPNMANKISPEHIGIYFDYLQYKMKQAGDAIWRGAIPLSPLDKEKFLPSLEQYRSVSLFDATLPENQKRQLPTIDDLVQAMQDEMKGGRMND